MPLKDKKPRGALRLGFRLPVWLYRWHLGWMLGERFLLLTHQGRKSGVQHQTVIEVVHHDQAADTYHVVSGFGHRSDWFLNIRQNPKAIIQVGRRTLPVRAKWIDPVAGAEILQDYAREHPLAFRELSTLLTGKSIEPTGENCRSFLEAMPLVAFVPEKSSLE